jgi:hypothetical protein
VRAKLNENTKADTCTHTKTHTHTHTHTLEKCNEGSSNKGLRTFELASLQIPHHNTINLGSTIPLGASSAPSPASASSSLPPSLLSDASPSNGRHDRNLNEHPRCMHHSATCGKPSCCLNHTTACFRISRKLEHCGFDAVVPSTQSRCKCVVPEKDNASSLCTCVRM